MICSASWRARARISSAARILIEHARTLVLRPAAAAAVAAG